MLLKKIYEHKLDQYKTKIEEEMQGLINHRVTDHNINQLLHASIESGRRVRPLLFLLAHKIFIKDLPPHAFALGAALELLHKASLVHDDLVDRDEFRRGKASFYHTFGERQAIIVGDLLVSLAFEQFLRSTADPFLIREWAELYRRLALGELQDLVWEGRSDISEAELRQMIDGKTASFLEFALKAGTYLAISDTNTAAQMGQIGSELGFAFQIMNDLNNWQGLEAELGRNPQWDVTSGKVNLVTRLVHSAEKAGTEPSTIRDMVTEQVKDFAGSHIVRARQILDGIGVENRYTQVLHYLMNEFDQKWFWVEKDASKQ